MAINGYYTYYSNQWMLLFGVTQYYTYLLRMSYSIKQSHFWSIMSKQSIEVLLVKIKLMSKTWLHCNTPNTSTHYTKYDI